MRNLTTATQILSPRGDCFKTEPSSADTLHGDSKSALVAGLLELATGVGLAEAPAGGRHVVGRDGTAVAGGDPEGQRLAVEHGAVLPVGAPVVAHGQPSCARSFHVHRRQVAGAGNVGDEHQVEVGVAGDGEPDATRLDTHHPTECNKYILARDALTGQRVRA